VTNRSGFTIVEVLVAVLVLTVGLLGLAATAATVTRMISQGQRYSEATTLAAQRFEVLRSQSCTAMAAGSETHGRYSVAWTLTSVNSGKANQVTVVVVSPTARATRADSFQTTIPCGS
jgi:type IV pilus modification protein PilV